MITFHNGNLLESECDLICQQVNEWGVMGAGLARQIADIYPLCEKEYRENYKKYNFGDVLYWWGFPVIANCFSQRNGKTDYAAVRDCFTKIKYYVRETHYIKKIGVPYKYGCGIADGEWEKVLAIFKELFEKDEEKELQIWRLKCIK